MSLGQSCPCQSKARGEAGLDAPVHICNTLFVGETSSGKSCLINLILGIELLPYTTLSTTSTICEIKYGQRPKLVVHYRNNSEKPLLLPKTVELQEPDACGRSYREQIDPYVHRKKDRETSFLYEKVEIFWPNELLKVKNTLAIWSCLDSLV